MLTRATRGKNAWRATETERTETTASATANRRENGGGNVPRNQETAVRAIFVLDEILKNTDPIDPNYQYLLLLRHQLEVDEQQSAEAQELIAKYDEAYNKLTAPANRVAVFLSKNEDGTANIAMGDNDFYTNVDPNIELDTLQAGTRVKVNEAYAVVGDLGPAQNGQVVKVTEALDDGRLRIGGDMQGQNTRVVMRGEGLKDATIKTGTEVRMEPNFRVALEAFAGQRNAGLLPGHSHRNPLGQDRRPAGGHRRHQRCHRTAPAVPRTVRALRQAAAEGHSAVRPSRLRQDADRQGDGLQHHPGIQGADQAGRQRVLHVHQRPQDPEHVAGRVGAAGARDLLHGPREGQRGLSGLHLHRRGREHPRTRSSGRFTNISNTVVPQFCAEMDGLVSLENVVVMLTSNRPDYIDPAILRPERIDRKVKVVRPDKASTHDILGIYLHKDLPLDYKTVDEQGGVEKARQYLMDKTTELIWAKTHETEFLEVYLRNGSVDTLYWKDLVSGALLTSVVERAKDYAIKRSIDVKSTKEGVSWDDLERAVRTEYKENEIFPKTDNLGRLAQAAGLRAGKRRPPEPDHREKRHAGDAPERDLGTGPASPQ